MWHRPRTQGIHPEAVSDLVVKKPKSVGKTGVKSTLYRAYAGPLPEPHILASGAKLSEIHPRPLMSHILEGISSLELVPSQFGPVPRGCTLSYQCPPLTPDLPVIDFPPLPLPGFSFSSNLGFVPNLHQALHLESLKVSSTTADEIEMGTREQSKCAAWVQMRRSRVTASRFREVCYVRGETSGKALATRIIRGTKQTHAMWRGLELEASILKIYTESTNVIVLPCGFVVHPEAPHLGASPDGKVFDETETYPLGLVEVKSTSAENVATVPYIKITNGQAKLKESHKYYWQVLGQLAVTGLNWCDFVIDTAEDLIIQRIWRDDEFIASMKERLDLYYHNVYMAVYLPHVNINNCHS